MPAPITTPRNSALAIAKARKVLPTWLSHHQLLDLEAGLRARSVFSARTTHARYLHAIAAAVQRLLSREGADAGSLREALKEIIQKAGYTPEAGFPGDEALDIPPAVPNSITDLSSQARIDLILRTQVALMTGKAQQQRGLTPAALELFPAYELVRISQVEAPRDWPKRWQTACENAEITPLPDGELIALKTSPLWQALGSSSIFEDCLDVSHPPFAFNSGMGWRAVSRARCLRLGLITEHSTQVVPQAQKNSTAKLPAATASTDGLTPDLVRELLRTMQGTAVQAPPAQIVLKAPGTATPPPHSAPREREATPVPAPAPPRSTPPAKATLADLIEAMRKPQAAAPSFTPPPPPQPPAGRRFTARFNALLDQLRIPAGQADGGRWTTVEIGAVRVWQALKKRGHDVQRGASVQSLDDGTLYTAALAEPVFFIP